jgi:hypothetical protein
MAVTQEPIADKPVVNTRALDDALNTQMAGLPPEVRAASKTRQLAAKAQSDVDQALASKQREVYEPIESRYREQVQQTQQQVGDIGQQLAKPFEVPKETVSDFAALGGLVAIAGTLLGSSGKQSANNVLASMTGIVSGYKKGRQDLIQQAFKEFEVNMKRLQALSTNAQTQLELASKLSATDKEKAKLLFAEIQAKYNGSIVAAKVAGEDAFTALTAANQVKQTNISASNAAQRIKEWKEGEETRRLQREKAQQDLLLGQYETYTDSKTGQIVRINKITGEKTAVAGTEGFVKPGTKPLGAADIKALKKGEAVANFVSDTIGKRVDADTASKATATVDFISKLNELKEANVRLGNVSGASVALANVINPFLTSAAEYDPVTKTSRITQETLDQAWENAKDSKEYKALSDKAKVMAKMELDTTMSYLQAKYGNRAPVAEFRAAQSNLSRKAANPDSYNQIMNNEIRASQARFALLGFDANDYNLLSQKLKSNVAGFEQSESSGGQYFVVAPNGKTYEFSTQDAADQFKKKIGIQ